jgi:hypothetical protein
VSSTRHAAVACANKTPPPFPRPLPTRPVPTITLAGCVSRFRLCVLPQKNLLFFASLRTGQYQTVTATSRHLSSAPFDGDVGYVVTDAYLLCRRVDTRGRGCQPQCVDFGQKQSTQAVTSCRLHSLPQRTNPHPAHVQPSNTTWPTSHARASLWGGVMPMNKRGYYHFDGRGEGGWWSRSRRLMGGNATTSRGGREREAAAWQEAKTKVKIEVQTATMTARLLVAMTTSATQTNNQPTTGPSECRGPFGEARAEGRRQSHQRLRCLQSRDQQCNKSCRHQASADDRRWDDVPWCNRRRRCTIDGGAGGQGWEDEDDETL